MKHLARFSLFFLLVGALLFGSALSTSGAETAVDQQNPQPIIITGSDNPTPTAEPENDLDDPDSDIANQRAVPIAADLFLGDATFPSASSAGTEFLFSVPVGDEGFHYEGGGMPDSLRWGPTAIAVADDGKIWIADTAAHQLLAFTPAGHLSQALDLQGIAVGVTDLAVKDGKIWLLDTAAEVPSLLQLDSLDGAVLDRQELLEPQSPMSIVEDEDGQLMLNNDDNIVSQLLFGAVSPTEVGDESEDTGGPVEERSPKTAPKPENPRSERVIQVGQVSVQVKVENDLGGVRLLGRQTDGSFYIIVEEVTTDGVILVDQTLRHYGPAGELLGMARFPLQNQHVYVQENMALGLGGEVFTLLTRPDRVEVHRLTFSDELEPILPSGTVQLPDLDGLTSSNGCTISRSQIRANAVAYTSNSTTLSSANTDGYCSGRIKPRSISGPGSYNSVAYDWGGWDTVSNYNSRMRSGDQAGDRYTPAVGCSRGVDCSGFITRIWGRTNKKYSTRTIHEISSALASKDSLAMGDILNSTSVGHVVMFDRTTLNGLYTFESTTYDNRDKVTFLWNRWSRFNNYQPRRYTTVCTGETDDGRTINNGQTLNGTISPSSDTDTYYFNGSQGQKATIRMNRSSGSSLDSYLYLYAPNGQRVAYDDDGGGFPNAKINQVTLPQNGRYRIIARSYGGYSSGAYSVHLQLSTPSTTCSAGQYRAEYFNNRYLNDPPTFTRCESSINKDWGSGGPGNGIGNDNFSVRWTGRFNFSSSSYTFTARADDGILVKLDGVTVINGWRDQSPTTYRNTRNVSSGTRTVKVEYYENGGGAVAQLSWRRNTPTCSPGENQVALYVDSSYRGQCVVKNVGSYANPGAIGLPNDAISSVKVGRNVVLRLYQHDNYAGSASSFAGNDSNLSNNSIGNDSASSMKVWRRSTPTCSPGADQVALYVDSDYRGQCVVKNIGSYANPGAIGLPNDAISSVKVGSNVVLRLYQHDNYAGNGSSFISNDSNLSNNTIGSDSASSLRVWRRSSPNLALGRPSWATSQEASYTTASRANDGSIGTRWSSRHSSTNTTEWWRVDVGSGRTFDQTKIRWETAYAGRHFVGWSNDGRSFTGYWYRISAPGYYRYNLGTHTAKYVGVKMTEHANCCGNYSLWEFEVYRAASSAGSPQESLELEDEFTVVQDILPDSELVTIQISQTE